MPIMAPHWKGETLTSHGVAVSWPSLAENYVGCEPA